MTQFFGGNSQTLVVDRVNGSDLNTISTRTGPYAYPYKTITESINAAVSGQEITVMPGTYNEALLLKNGVDLTFKPNAIVDCTLGSGKIPLSDGRSANPGLSSAVTCKILGYGVFRKGGVAATGDNPVLALYNSSSSVYLEAASCENYCTNANETEVFKLENGASLRVRQTAPGVMRSLTYDFIVGYTHTGIFDGEFYDLVQGAESICEFGTTAAPRFRFKAKRTLSAGGSENSAFDFQLISITSGTDVSVNVLEEIRHNAAFPAIFPGGASGKYYFNCPLILSSGEISVNGSDSSILYIDGAQIVSGGSNKAAIQLNGANVILNNCTLFPTGSAKSVIGAATVECKNVFATAAADTGGGVTLVGVLNIAATITVPT